MVKEVLSESAKWGRKYPEQKNWVASKKRVKRLFDELKPAMENILANDTLSDEDAQEVSGYLTQLSRAFGVILDVDNVDGENYWDY